jgi:hypothetical protein
LNEHVLKESLRVLADQAVERVFDDFRKLNTWRGEVVNFSSQRDALITELPTFKATLHVLNSLPLVKEQYGTEVSDRLLLEFIYVLLRKHPQPKFDPEVFERTWRAFWEEISEPEWTYLGLVNLQRFSSESDLLDLGDGITIRASNFDKLLRMGWRESHIEAIRREQQEGYFPSSHFMVVEHRLPKTPQNALNSRNLAISEKADRALLTLRLHKCGNIGVGQLWEVRLAPFDLTLGGVSSSTSLDGNYSSFLIGDEYALSASEIRSVRDLYSTLLRYESVQDKAPVNLDLALQYFSGVYDRHAPSRADARLVDCITAIEALLGAETEIVFKLAFRVANILGTDDNERVYIFNQMKGYYDVRSRVVHGQPLKAKHHSLMQNEKTLLDLLRRLLVGFLRLTMSSGHLYTKTFFLKNLDSALLHSERRSELRMAMGLEDSSPAN